MQHHLEENKLKKIATLSSELMTRKGKMGKYHKGDKFVIEIAEKHTHYNDKNEPYALYRIKGFNSLVFDDNGLNKLHSTQDTNVKKGTTRAKYQKAIDILKDFVIEDGATCDQDVLVKSINTIQYLLESYMTMCRLITEEELFGNTEQLKGINERLSR